LAEYNPDFQGAGAPEPSIFYADYWKPKSALDLLKSVSIIGVSFSSQ
jgi:hypothetical protein